MRRDVRQSIDGSAEPQLGEIEEVPDAGTTRFSSSGAIPAVAPFGTAPPTASERAFGPTTTLPPDLANKEPGMLWQRQGAGSGVASETKNSADTSKKDRRPEQERRADHSDNATYHAMNTKLKLLAYELHAAGTKLTFDVAVANADKKQDKAQIGKTEAGLMVTIHRVDDMARETAKQLSDLRTANGEPRLVEGARSLVASLNEFEPVMTEVDAWMTAHKVDTPSWEVVGRSNGILKLIFPSIAPAAMPLTSVEKSSGFMKDSSINAHLDAAIAAAESMKSGNTILHSDRVILHAKELAELLKNHPRVEGQLEPRIKKLIGLVDQILVQNPYLKRSFDEAIDPIRNVK
jgi:hypothetical protein